MLNEAKKKKNEVAVLLGALPLERETEWVGDKAQVTETCDRQQPALITQVTTTAATTHDSQALPGIQAALAAKDLLPAEHLVDAGYFSAEHLVSSQQQYQLDLIGPHVSECTTWHLEAQRALRCASFRLIGNTSRSPARKARPVAAGRPCSAPAGHDWIQVRFATSDCQACPGPCGRHPRSGRTLESHGAAGIRGLVGGPPATDHAGEQSALCPPRWD